MSEWAYVLHVPRLREWQIRDHVGGIPRIIAKFVYDVEGGAITEQYAENLARMTLAKVQPDAEHG